MEGVKVMASKKPKVKGKRGPKDKWTELDMPSKLATVQGWAKQGSTDIEICEMLGVSKDTFYKWKKEKPEFKAAIIKGKHDSNGEILNASFKMATGFYQTVTEPFKVKTYQEFEGENGTFFEEVEQIVDHTYQKYFPPNATMQIFMLKNRLPLEYRDKHDLNHLGNVGVTLVDNIPEDDETHGND